MNGANNLYFDKEKLEKLKNNFDDLSDLDLNIIYLVKEKHTYGNIQLILGNPSKRYIRSVLKEHAPQLLIRK